jgi:hypothetical protein
MASKAGTNTRLARRVQPRLRRRRRPMLAVPGWAERAREPKAVPVVRAEKMTARAVGDSRGRRWPARQFMTK